MNVAARPVLHWVLDRPGAAERVLTLRPAGLSFPIVGADQRDLHLSWVAADPLPRDPNWQSVTAWSGSGQAAGRAYPLTFNRSYPSGGSSGTLGTIISYGDVPVSPLLYIYGPITRPQVTIANLDNSGTFTVTFLASFTIQASHYVVVDTPRNRVPRQRPDPAGYDVDRLDVDDVAAGHAVPEHESPVDRGQLDVADHAGRRVVAGRVSDVSLLGHGGWRLTAHRRMYASGALPRDTIIGELDGARSRRLTQAWNKPATLTFTVDGHSPGAAVVSELTTDVIAWRWDDNQQRDIAMFRGIVSQAQDVLSEQTAVVTFTCHDYLAMLARRFWTGPSPFVWTQLTRTPSRPGSSSQASSITNGTGTTSFSPASFLPLAVELLNPSGNNRGLSGVLRRSHVRRADRDARRDRQTGDRQQRVRLRRVAGWERGRASTRCASSTRTRGCCGPDRSSCTGRRSAR